MEKEEGKESQKETSAGPPAPSFMFVLSFTFVV